MNIVEMHNSGLYRLGRRLEKEFESELKMLTGAAMFCYLTHRSKFTILYLIEKEQHRLVR